MGPAVIVITGAMAAGKSPTDFDRHLRQDTPPVGLWLDTSGQTAEETVQAILTELPAARVE